MRNKKALKNQQNLHKIDQILVTIKQRMILQTDLKQMETHNKLAKLFQIH
jgi:hypothetical protein